MPEVSLIPSSLLAWVAELHCKRMILQWGDLPPSTTISAGLLTRPQHCWKKWLFAALNNDPSLTLMQFITWSAKDFPCVSISH